nr:Zinc finger protein [Ipomoea batatas]
MNPSKVEEDMFHHHLSPHHHILDQSQPPLLDPPAEEEEPFAFHDLVLFRDDDEDDASHTSSEAELPIHQNQHQSPSQPPPLIQIHNQSNLDTSVFRSPNPSPNLGAENADANRAEKRQRCALAYISPDPHISSQFYTFNKESHSLMIRCLLEGRAATPDEIRAANPSSVLSSWRSVWKDRNEDTAYLTAWKRIQDKLSAHVDTSAGNEFLYFKNNSNQCVSHVDQWHDIVTHFHCDAELKHLGLKETLERIKQMWTVGAKFYGIPESYIRVCVAACPVCLDESSGCAPRSKRRRFEYTESIDVPAKEVPTRLQQLAAKHKVVLCIRQKYIRYKPFMAEVKDYTCHRAGEPASSKKSRILKREPYASKRCGCGFRIRAIVPISNYNEKDKTFVYQEEGTAVFKLYAVHSGHEPGPLDGNARIMHRVVGHKGGFLMDQETIYGVGEEAENEDFGLLGKDEGDMQHSVLQQVQEVRNEIELLEGEIRKIPHELLCSASRELFEVVNKLKNVREYGSKSGGLLSDKQNSGDVLMGENDLVDWGGDHHQRIYEDGKDAEFIEEDEDSFGRTLGEVASWDQIRTGSRSEKDLLGETCKSEKPLKCIEFDEKSILDCGDSKLTKPLRHDEGIDTDVGFVVENFYENPKWFDSPCGLDSGADCGDGEFRHGGIV